MSRRIFHRFIAVLLVVIMFTPVPVGAQSSSTNYQVEEAQFGTGAELEMTSPNYQAQGSAGSLGVGNTASPNFFAETGFLTPNEEFLELMVYAEAGWQSRRQITFDNSTGAETFTDFPVRVSLSSSNIDYSKTQNNGEDLRFTDAQGTILSHEIESWNESGTSEVWVKVPRINAGSVTDHIWMFYNNPSAPDAQNVADVWSNGYIAVWHMDESSGTVLNDSTGNNNATKVSATEPSPTTLRVNGAQDFDGVNDKATVTSSINSLTSNFTVESWFNNDLDNGLDRMVVHKQHGNSSQDSFQLFITEAVNDNVRFRVTNSSGSGVTNVSSGSTYPTLNQTVYAAGTYDGSNARLYLNGSSTPVDTDALSGAIEINSKPITIGSGASGEWFPGIIDETRISKVTRSGEWIEAQHKSMSNTMNTFGTEDSGWYGIGRSVDLGLLSASSTNSATAGFRVRAYTSSGYVVKSLNDTPVNEGGARLDPIVAPGDPVAGTEQFGINLVANTLPTIFGANPSPQPDSTFAYGVAAPDYTAANKFKYLAGDTIATSTKGVGNTLFTVSYVAGASPTTESGVYTVEQDLMVVATY